MHMRITPLTAPADATVTELEQHRGLVSALVLRPMDQQQTILVSVWDAVEDADEAVGTAGGRDYPDTTFEAATGAHERPAYGQLISFDGPRPRAEADAIDRANRERIAPAVRGVPGNVGAYLGRAPDGSLAVVALTTSLQAVEDTNQAIMSTSLLPGEDPATLTGPSRIQISWVLAASRRTVPIPH